MAPHREHSPKEQVKRERQERRSSIRARARDARVRALLEEWLPRQDLGAAVEPDASPAGTEADRILGRKWTAFEAAYQQFSGQGDDVVPDGHLEPVEIEGTPTIVPLGTLAREFELLYFAPEVDLPDVVLDRFPDYPFEPEPTRLGSRTWSDDNVDDAPRRGPRKFPGPKPFEADLAAIRDRDAHPREAQAAARRQWQRVLTGSIDFIELRTLRDAGLRSHDGIDPIDVWIDCGSKMYDRYRTLYHRLPTPRDTLVDGDTTFQVGRWAEELRDARFDRRIAATRLPKHLRELFPSKRQIGRAADAPSVTRNDGLSLG